MTEKSTIVRLDEFRTAPSLSGDSGRNHSLANTELSFMRSRLADALDDHPKGNISRAAMIEVFRTDRINEAISYEWQTQEPSKIWPGMEKEAFEEAVEASSNARGLHLRIKMWEAVRALVADDGPDRSGWIIRCEDKARNAIVKLRWREDIKAGWADGVVVTMDATFSRELVEPYFQRPLDILTADDVKMDHVTTLQVVDKSFAATSLIPANDNDDKRRENRAREVWRWIQLRSIQYRGKGQDGIDVLVLCQMGLEVILREWGLPTNVEIAHFNDFRGLDRWGGVRCLISVGRVTARPSDVEAIAEALTGRAVTERVTSKDWYPKETVGIRLANGSGWPVENDRHPDPIAEAVRHQICEVELIQGIGRPRGVNRTAETPLQVDVLTNICLPLTVHQPIRWEDHAPGKIEEMICRGVLPKSFAVAAQLYPDLWSSEDAARKAAARRLTNPITDALKPDISLLVYSIWGMSGLRTLLPLNLTSGLATISRAKRSQIIPFLFDPILVPEPVSWLADRLSANVTTLIGADAETEWQKRQEK